MQTETLFIWRFTPVARPDDPAWQGRAIWSDLRVVAPTAGAAILVAGRHYQEAHGIDTEASQDRQQVRSGFEDVKLYRLDRLEPVLEGLAEGSVHFEKRLAKNDSP
jgi:hypothetical protein